MVKYLVQDRHPYLYRAVSHDPKENKFLEHTRSGGPGSPKENRKEIDRDEVHRIISTEPEGYKRQYHEQNIKKYLDHELPTYMKYDDKQKAFRDPRSMKEHEASHWKKD